MGDRPPFTRQPGESLDAHIARLQAVDAVVLPDTKRNALNFSLREALREQGQRQQDERARQGISGRARKPPRPSAELTPLERARKVVAGLNDQDWQLLLREMMEAEAKLNSEDRSHPPSHLGEGQQFPAKTSSGNSSDR